MTEKPFPQLYIFYYQTEVFVKWKRRYLDIARVILYNILKKICEVYYEYRKNRLWSDA